ncbi:MAG: LysM domain-containing protein [Actinomycetes bacterium]
MTAVVVVPHHVSHPTHHLDEVPARPPLRVIPGGRKAARAHALGYRSSHGRLHPAIYRRRRLGVALAMVTVAVMASFAVTNASKVSANGAPTSPVSVTKATATDSYVVQAGDTLWSIARRIHPSGDVRGVVDRLADRAGSTVLQPGQSIRINDLAS